MSPRDSLGIKTGSKLVEISSWNMLLRILRIVVELMRICPGSGPCPRDIVLPVGFRMFAAAEGGFAAALVVLALLPNSYLVASPLLRYERLGV